jgi:hypothetical protein
VAELLERLRRHVRDRGAGRRLPERLEGRNPGRAQALDLVVADPGDLRQVVVVCPALLAELEEVAKRAVSDRVGIGGGPVVLGSGFSQTPRDCLPEPCSRPPEEGGEVGGPKRLHLACAEDDVHPFGQPPLDALELVRVEGELEDGVRLRAPRELRVPGFVGEGAERRGLVDADEKVDDPAPFVGREDGLIDDLLAGAERLLGAAGGLLEVNVLAEADLGDVAALREELREERRLVLVAMRRMRSACGFLRRDRTSCSSWTPTSSCVRCAQARWFTRPEGESRSVPLAASRISRSMCRPCERYEPYNQPTLASSPCSNSPT